MITSIAASVYCISATEHNSTYRVYLDNELMIERPWIWPKDKTYIEEQIEANLEPGKHELRIEASKEKDSFLIKTVKVNDQLKSCNFLL